MGCFLSTKPTLEPSPFPTASSKPRSRGGSGESSTTQDGSSLDGRSGDSGRKTSATGKLVSRPGGRNNSSSSSGNLANAISTPNSNNPLVGRDGKSASASATSDGLTTSNQRQESPADLFSPSSDGRTQRRSGTTADGSSVTAHPPMSSSSSAPAPAASIPPALAAPEGGVGAEAASRKINSTTHHHPPLAAHPPPPLPHGGSTAASQHIPAARSIHYGGSSMRSSLNSCTAQAALDYHSESSRHESTLSDITFSSESTVSDVFLDEDGPLTGGRSARGQGAKGREATEPFTFLAKGGDLERQRQEVPLSIEQDLFVYDDIIISKGTARTNKHWRLAGRKPLHMEGGNIPNVSSRSSISGPSGSGQKYFSFNDFDVCVDEMDVAPSTGSAPTAIEAFQKETKRRSLDAGSSHSSTTDLDRTDDGTRRITVISTINTKRKTTSAAALEETSSKSKNPQRKVLRKFECRSILGHATRVKCIALSASEKDYASCSNEDASVILNNLNVEDEVGIFTGHLDAVINATFSPDGKFLATTSKDKTMILWDVMTTKALLTFTHARVVICCCFAPDSKYIVSGCQDRVCRLWDIKHGREWLNYSHHEGIIISVTFSPDGSHVCSASADKTLRVWSSNTSKTKFTLTGHVGIILSCSYTSDGQYIISNDECLLRVWSTTDGSCMLSLSPSDLAGTPSVRGSKLGWTLSCAGPGAFSSYILVACNNRFVYVLDRETGKEVTSTYCKAPVYCLTGGTKQTAMCGDSFGNVYLLRLE